MAKISAEPNCNGVEALRSDKRCSGKAVQCFGEAELGEEARRQSMAKRWHGLAQRWNSSEVDREARIGDAAAEKSVDESGAVKASRSEAVRRSAKEKLRFASEQKSSVLQGRGFGSKGTGLRWMSAGVRGAAGE